MLASWPIWRIQIGGKLISRRTVGGKLAVGPKPGKYKMAKLTIMHKMFMRSLVMRPEWLSRKCLRMCNIRFILLFAIPPIYQTVCNHGMYFPHSTPHLGSPRRFQRPKNDRSRPGPKNRVNGRVLFQTRLLFRQVAGSKADSTFADLWGHAAAVIATRVTGRWHNG